MLKAPPPSCRVKYLILSIFRCDNKFHCKDSSDEENCSDMLVNPEQDYDLGSPPISSQVVDEDTQVPNTIITAHITIRETFNNKPIFNIW